MLILIFSILGTVSFLYDLSSAYKNTINKAEVFERWEEQLPKTHWIKNEDKYMVQMIQGAYNSNKLGNGILEISTVIVKNEMGIWEDIIEYIIIDEKENKYIKKY